MDEITTIGHHSAAPFSLNNWPVASPPLSHGQTVTGEDVKQLQAMLAVTTGDRRHTSFVPGVYCAFTEDCVRDFQLNNGLEVTGEVDDRTWELLAEQVGYRRKKEEERAHRREEAQRKAKMEMERKLQQQKEESARAMDNIMEKTLNSIGLAKGAGQKPATTIVLGGVSPNLTAASSPMPPTSPSTATMLADFPGTHQ
jgi:peptidoglycan hydrolase-like protein with peptidoglycan-binding domain